MYSRPILIIGRLHAIYDGQHYRLMIMIITAELMPDGAAPMSALIRACRASRVIGK